MKTIIFTLAICLLFSCSKEMEESSRTSLLTGKAWKFVKIESKMNNDPWVDEVLFWLPCEKDDEILFKTDGSYILSNGATKCDASDPDIFDVARWDFLENETKLSMDGAVAAIDELTSQRMVLSATQVSGAGTAYTRLTLEH